MFKIPLPFWLYYTASVLIATGISGGINAFATFLFYDLWADEENPATTGKYMMDVVMTVMFTSLNAWFWGGHFCIFDTRGYGTFKISKRPKLESIPNQLRFLLRPAQAWIFENTCVNIKLVLVWGVLFGILDTVTIGAVFMLVGKFALGDAPWPLKTLLIYKGALGAIVGCRNAVPVVLLAGVVMEEEDDEPVLKDTEADEEIEDDEENPTVTVAPLDVEETA